MVSIPKLDSPQTVCSDQSAAAGTSDTESNSGRDNEVSLLLLSQCAFFTFHGNLANQYLGNIRMFSTLRQKWKEGVYRMPLRLHYGFPHQSG